MYVGPFKQHAMLNGRPTTCWNFLMAGLSGTSFTGYPLPDVAAGINLKNQVAGESSFLAVPKTCSRVKFSRRTCLEKNPQLGEISARGCQALQRCFSQRNEKEQSDKKSNLKKEQSKKKRSQKKRIWWCNPRAGELGAADRGFWKSRVDSGSSSSAGGRQVQYNQEIYCKKSTVDTDSENQYEKLCKLAGEL